MPKNDPEPRPLTRTEEKFITKFLQFKDIYKAAEKAGIAKNQAAKTFNKIEVQEEIERQQDVLRQERARQQVENENLTNEFLDSEMVKHIRKESGQTKTDALRLAYITTGRIQAGQTRVLDPGGVGDGAEHVATPGNFYQAFVPVGVAVSPILPDPTPATVPQSAEPIGKPAPPTEALRAAVRDLTTPKPPAPPASPAVPPRRAKLIVE